MGRILTKKGGRVVLNEQVKSQKETGKLCLKVELQSLHDMQDSTRQTWGHQPLIATYVGVLEPR